MTLTPEEFDKLLIRDDEEPLPPTERRPDLAKAWAEHMNDVREIDVCPECNRLRKSLTGTSG